MTATSAKGTSPKVIVRGRLRPAEVLTAAVAILVVPAALAGLAVDGLYQDPAPLAETFRAADLVNLVVAAPLLAVTAVSARRRSLRMQLLRLAGLAYFAYSYALCVFGAAFNDIFLLHVAVLSLSVFGLVAAAADLDVARAGFGPRTPARSVAAVLAFLALGLAGMWIFYSVRFAVTGAAPEEAAVVSSVSSMHLAYAMDLAFLVPAYALGAVLLWRRRPLGYVLGTVLLTSGAIHQVSYMTALVFQARADIADATPFDPAEPPILIAYVVGAALLFHHLRDRSVQLGRGPSALLWSTSAPET